MDEEEVKKDITEEAVKVEDAVEEIVTKSTREEELEKELETVRAERDTYLRERDEANAMLRDSKRNEDNEPDDFDDYFGGIK